MTTILKQTEEFTGLDLDFDERSLIVNYSLKLVHGNSTGKPVGTTVEPHKKRIRLKPFAPEVNLKGLAEAIVKSCAIIPKDRLTAVVTLLEELRHHDDKRAVTAPAGRANPATKMPDAPSRSRFSDHASSKEEDVEADDDSGDEKTVRIDKLEDYMEKLYEEDVNKRIEGAKQILALAKQPILLPQLIDDDTLMGALTRVVREDWKKNTDLMIVMMQIFFCMSHYNQMHPLLSTNRIGDLSMKIVELEHRRHTARMLDLERFAKLAELQASGNSAGEAAFRNADAEERAAEEKAAEAAAQAVSAKAVAAAEKVERAAVESKRGKKSRVAAADDADHDEEDGDAEATTSSSKAAADVEAAKRIKLKPLPTGHVDIEKERKKVRALMRKQEALIFTCLSLLMNLAVDVAVEKKMCKRNITGLLVPLLDRDNVPLLLLVTAFLRKLSVFEENKDAMAALDIANKIVAILPSSLDDPATQAPSVILLLQSVLRLGFNLTFDKGMREEFVEQGLVGKLALLLRAAPFRGTALKMLYHLSQDYSARAAFAEAGVLPLVVKIVVGMPQSSLPPELAGLLLNVCAHPVTCSLLCNNDVPKLLLQRLAKTGDIIVLKALRNLAQFTYSLQADECLKAAAAEEEMWRKQQIEERKAAAAEENARRKQHASESKEEKKDDEDDNTAAPADGEEDDMRFLLPVPDEPIEYDYSLEGLWAPCVRDVVAFGLRNRTNADILVEVFGFLASLTIRDFPESMSFATLLEDKEFVAVLEKSLQCQSVDDDVLLEAIQVVAAAALDADAAAAISETAVIPSFAGIFAEKASDVEIMVQCVCAITRLLHNEISAEIIVRTPKLCLRMVELLSCSDAALVSEVDECVSLIIEHDRAHSISSIWQQLLTRRFQLYNREWLAEYAGMGGSRARTGAMAMPKPSTNSPRSPGFMQFGSHHQNIAVDLSSLYETASRISKDYERRAVHGEEDDEDDHVSPEVRALVNQYMKRGSLGTVDTRERASVGSARAVSGWEVHDDDDEHEQYGYGR